MRSSDEEFHQLQSYQGVCRIREGSRPTAVYRYESPPHIRHSEVSLPLFIKAPELFQEQQQLILSNTECIALPSVPSLNFVSFSEQRIYSHHLLFDFSLCALFEFYRSSLHVDPIGFKAFIDQRFPLFFQIILENAYLNGPWGFYPGHVVEIFIRPNLTIF